MDPQHSRREGRPLPPRRIAAQGWLHPRRRSPGQRQAAAEADDAPESLFVLVVDDELLDPESELVPVDPEEPPDPPSDFAGALFEPEA
ncbi:hypothetical protein BE08_09665 [Sorangium cellulosum]|uniref:Uncharacterized protein n=1 Tax=Sorangium cellulosum TaxID=56 RepID=A0A150PNG3_SORCE|nr:hypothetical protein BE08_09665 [Sorangium cellulosum]